MIARYALTLLALVAAPAAAQRPHPAQAALEAARVELGLPGMAAAVWKDGQLILDIAAGERALGSGVPVAVGDPFHIGSITKPFTATLAARLAEQGRIGFGQRIADLLPDLSGLRPEYAEVTLADLLAHRGGISASPSPEEGARLVRLRGLTERRLAVAEIMLAMPPSGTPRRTFLYSNFSYVIAAAMMERATGRPYEELVAEEVLAPLGLASAGFGAPGSPAAIDAPRGHFPEGTNLAGPIDPASPIADNPAFAQPSGGLHMSMRDLAAFGADHLRGALGQPGTLLRPESYAFLHAPVPGAEATGWALGPGAERHHDGSNRRWYALLRFIPEERLVIAVAGNSAGDERRTGPGLFALSDRLRRLVR
ncbi:MAG: serine hydrolase domain-containing protein [Allosphingosinicella sp.]|uniref:serine hydrolase domain-containing protein n=1 Tax=Allosphingosinicella sp. TaxID=2823234 RepID=UPI0039456379